MTPDATLHAYISAGSDKSDTVIMVEGRDIVCGKLHDDGKNLANVVLAEGKDLFAEQTDSGSIGTYGRREAYLSTQNSATTAQATAAASLLLARTKTSARAIGLTVRTETFFPFLHYSLGDYIYIDAPSLVSDSYRVLSISIQEGQGPCDLTVSLELHNRAFDFLTQLDAQLKALQQNRSTGKAATSGLSSGPTVSPGDASRLRGKPVSDTAPSDGEVLTWDAATGHWHPASSPGGASDFLGLTDTPASYTGQKRKLVSVNAAESGLEFLRPPIADWNYKDTNRSTSGYAWKGNRVIPYQDILVYAIGYFGNVVAGASYQAAIITVSGNTIATIQKTATVTIPASASQTNGVTLWLFFDSPITLSAGGTYYLAVGRTDGSDTYALPVPFDSSSADQFNFLPAAQGEQYIRIAKANPAVGDTVYLTASTHQVSQGLLFAL